ASGKNVQDRISVDGAERAAHVSSLPQRRSKGRGTARSTSHYIMLSTALSYPPVSPTVALGTCRWCELIQSRSQPRRAEAHSAQPAQYQFAFSRRPQFGHGAALVFRQRHKCSERGLPFLLTCKHLGTRTMRKRKALIFAATTILVSPVYAETCPDPIAAASRL